MEIRYPYDGLLEVQERNGANTPTVTYTRGRDLSGTVAGAGGIGGLLARSHGYSGGNWTSHTFYHADGNGNVTALVNSAGTLQASYRYDPYGRWLSGGGSLASANGLRFSSKPWVGFAGSTTSGLYSYGYRFYDPYLQRWVVRDPIGEVGGINLYGYARNEPMIKRDTLGLWTDEYFFYRELCEHDPKRDCESRGGTWASPADVYWGGDTGECVAAVFSELAGQLALGYGMGVGGIIGGRIGSGIIAIGIGAVGVTVGGAIVIGIVYSWCATPQCL